MTPEYITIWRKTGDECLDWDSHTSMDAAEAKRCVDSIQKRGVVQYHTYKIAEKVDELSSAF
jgi:hypothetical protein